MSVEDVKRFRDQLLDSQWPVCDRLAETLAHIGGESAKAALIEGLRARRYHIRTACIRALMSFRDLALRPEFEHLLGDPAYDTRNEAGRALRFLDSLRGEGE